MLRRNIWLTHHGKGWTWVTREDEAYRFNSRMIAEQIGNEQNSLNLRMYVDVATERRSGDDRRSGFDRRLPT